MNMPGRKFTGGNSYRYGFNGQEKSGEIAESTTTAEFWEYDSRIGRRWNIDPIVKPWQSPYSCFSGNPIVYSDILGNDPIDKIKTYASQKNITEYKVKDSRLDGSMIMSWFSEDKNGNTVAHSKLFKPTKDESKRIASIELVFGRSEGASLLPKGLNKYSYYNFKNNVAQEVTINSFKDALYHSLKRIADEVYIGQDLLQKVKDDDGFKRFQQKYYTSGRSNYIDLVCFGGEPLDEEKIKHGSTLEKLYEAYKAISAATNELTWVVRNTMVTAQVYKNANNVLGVLYTFKDGFNVKPKEGDKGGIYNGVANIASELYHGYLGGNEDMKISMNLFIPFKK